MAHKPPMKKTPPDGALMNPPLNRWVSSSPVPASSTTEDLCTEHEIWTPKQTLSVHPICTTGDAETILRRLSLQKQS